MLPLLAKYQQTYLHSISKLMLLPLSLLAKVQQ
jgi:hypothetical protein